MKVITTCFEIYRYLDFIHDSKKYVPLKNSFNEPPKYLIDAYFYKMKADYMRYIFETLDCEDGLLYNVTERSDYTVAIREHLK